MGLFTRLARVGLLLDAFQHRVFDAFGLRFVDYSVLRVLQLAGPPYQASAGELSELVVRSSGGMTQILDRLEEWGYIERIADPNDRRKVLAGLTDEGLDIATRANAAYARERRRILKTLAPHEVEQADTAIRLLLGVFSTDAETAARA
jgi:DNA-binding MarR family transcriptional regulator